MDDLGIKEIQKIIPHRYPFLLVDRITDVQPGKSIRGYKNITAHEEVFQGHFPDDPIFPGVLIVEAMGQIGACLVLQSFPEERRMAYFAGFDKVRFKRLVVPGDRLDMKVNITRDRGTFVIMEGEASVDGEIAASATMMASLAKG